MSRQTNCDKIDHFMKFELKSVFKPTGDQPQAIESLVEGVKNKIAHQVLMGVTGSGKTYTAANIISRIKKPTLVISHNKTLAAQTYQELRDFFPKMAVCYFVSYYDFYQPEAYIPQTDTYIEKETQINDEIDKLRLSATANLLSRKDTIVVASVSCIYNLGSPKVYGLFILELKKGVSIEQSYVVKRLVDLQYIRSDFGFKRAHFRIRGESIDIFPAYEDFAYRIVENNGHIVNIFKIDPVSGDTKEEMDRITIYPAKHYMTEPHSREGALRQIRADLATRLIELNKQQKVHEAWRLNQKVNYDLEMIEELGYVNGIENYSRYFDGRKSGEAPYTLLDYYRETYGEEWLLFIDESHMTVPQIRGMYNGDRSRKQTLVDFGFRLPSAMDNRPLRFDEFMRRMPKTIYISATPDEWEMSLARESAAKVILSEHSESKDLSRMRARTSREIPRQARDDKNGVAEQLIRPTGIIDPEIIIRPSQGQINDLVKEIITRKKRHERVLVTTLTKKTAEDLANYLQEKNYLKKSKYNFEHLDEYPVVAYLHSDIETLERSDILDDLRGGKYDVLVGINLLREGLDLPEVSLVAILDADKEGFLRSETSLIQTMGRAARHIRGTVVMYADELTNSMKKAMKEIERRRKIQLEYNRKRGITPVQIVKPIRSKLVETQEEGKWQKTELSQLLEFEKNSLTPYDKNKFIKNLEREMKTAAGLLNFELAAQIRDKIRELKLDK